MNLTPALKIDNQLYERLGPRWYFAQNDPIALLRAESELRNPWVCAQIRRHFPGVDPALTTVLDIGCGGGFLSNELARRGLQVTGVDLSEGSLDVAREFDAAGSVNYLSADAHALPFQNASFDVVCAMDFLEHVEEPARVISEASRVLRPGGLFFFHTFNRNPIAGLVAIRGVEWFVQNTPPRMHVYDLFISPQELKVMCEATDLSVSEIRGCRPVVGSRAFWKLIFTGSVPKNFRFTWTRSTLISYSGCARKRGRRA